MSTQLQYPAGEPPQGKGMASRQTSAPLKRVARPTDERNVAIQWLRALAAIEVMIWHSDLVAKTSWSSSIQASAYSPLGGIGVEIFFVVSGFLMALITSTFPSAKHFIIGRLRRIVPLYWLFTTLVIVAFLINNRWQLGDFRLDSISLLKSYLIMPTTHYPILMVGWTLQYEIIFYIIVGSFIASAASRIPSARLAFGLCLALLGLSGTGTPDYSYVNPWLNHTLTVYMFAFGFGWLLACLGDCTRQTRITMGLCFALPFLTACALGGPQDRYLLLRIAVAAGVVIVGLSLRNALTAFGRIGRWIGLVGEASYSIYLSHWLVMSVEGKLLGLIALPQALETPVRLAGVLFAVLFGTAFYLLIEKPLDRRLRQLGIDRKPLLTAPATAPSGGRILR